MGGDACRDESSGHLYCYLIALPKPAMGSSAGEVGATLLVELDNVNLGFARQTLLTGRDGNDNSMHGCPLLIDYDFENSKSNISYSL